MDKKKLIYSILKELEQGNVPEREDYELRIEQWGEIVLLIKNEGYATGIAVAFGDNTIAEVSISSAKITMKGIEFLEENSGLAKTYKGIKEVRDWFKL
ncbi:YjcQ family protein [Oceanobacillus rekensis]|uniref:YjcQ family protein n=1 Tax=Oceanobacillus rekensis TaxID=937927 RepID=UPI0015936C64|nr:YjcQ family protein [Oceanobacillus rekensis]